MESMIGQMKTVRQNLQQVEAEKTELEMELSRLKNATDDDDFLKEKMADIQDGFDKQVRKIQSLQKELDSKNDEIDSLRLELVKKLQRIVEIEFDLETHEIHYTAYAAEQFKLGEEALNEIKTSKSSENSNDDSHSSIAADGSKKFTAKKAQKLISKLLSDLDNLELRYKEEKVKAASALEKVGLENDDLRAKVEILRKRAGDLSDNTSEQGDDSKDDSFTALTIAQIRKHADIAEARKNLFRKEVQHLRSEMDELKREAEADEVRAKLEIDALKDENQVLQTRISQLEAKQGGGLLKKKKKEDVICDKLLELEKKIQENYKERCRLESAVEIKDKQISTLKKEVANLRLRDISDGNINDTIYTEFDASLLRSAPSRPRFSVNHSSVAPGEGDDTAYVQDLQRQLQEAQHHLVKKDQELVIERAKAASTAAGLLARITELTGKKVEGKSQKQVPLRFYL